MPFEKEEKSFRLQLKHKFENDFQENMWLPVGNLETKEGGKIKKAQGEKKILHLKNNHRENTVYMMRS